MIVKLGIGVVVQVLDVTAALLLVMASFETWVYNQRSAVIFVNVCVKVKVRVKFTVQQATKAQRVSTGISLLFL